MYNVVMDLMAVMVFGCIFLLVLLAVMGCVLCVTRWQRIWCAVVGHSIEPMYIGETMVWHCWHCGKNFPRHPGRPA